MLSVQGDFEEAVVLQYTDPVPSEDTGMPLESTMRIIVARECNAGDVLRVILPQAAVQDLAGNILAGPLSAESTCVEQPLQELPHASRFLKVLGACLAALVVFGFCATAWLAWQALGGGEQEGGNIGGSMGHAAAAPVAVALATVALLLQGVFLFLEPYPLYLNLLKLADCSVLFSNHWHLSEVRVNSRSSKRGNGKVHLVLQGNVLRCTCFHFYAKAAAAMPQLSCHYSGRSWEA